jgi:hypothetical protein
MGWKLGSVLAASTLFLQIVDRHAESIGNLRQKRLHNFRIVAQQKHAERRIVVHQHAALSDPESNRAAR